ncbi:MAG: 30S ribosomal protein S6 [Gemmatimonadota bacterium]|nr:30S ribosomal protein S6 [Gemmatimonadota bacterium]
MREYEIVYIFRSNFTPEEIEARIERYHAILTQDGSGEITAVEQWGKRQLAYPIQKQPNGYYVVAQFTADPAVLPELERVLTLEEDLLRYLIVLSEGELPIPGSMQGAMDDRVPIASRDGSGDEKRPEKPAEGSAESGDAEGPAADDEAAADAEEGDAEEGDAEEGETEEGETVEAEDEGDGDADEGDAEAEADADADEPTDDAAADGAEGDEEGGDDAGDDQDSDEEAEEAAEKED